MVVWQQEFVHPTQASRVRLVVFEQPPEPPSVAGMPAGRGFLVTEERLGTRTVVATLGFYEDREAALERMRLRARELELQRYRPVNSAA